MWRSCISWLFREEKPDCPQHFIQDLTQSTSLTPEQIRHLYKRFCLIGGFKTYNPKNLLRKRDFLSVGKLTRNPLFAIILTSMFGEKRTINFIEFTQYLSTFGANYLNTKKEKIEANKKKKIRILFDMYDRTKDGRISREDLMYIVHKLYGDVINRRKVEKIADIMMVEMDLRDTDYILYDDFQTAMTVFDMDECLVTFIPGA